MAMAPVSLPRDNSLQALRALVEEKKREVRDNFQELRTALQQCEDRAAGVLDRLYSDTMESVESSERTIQQLEEAKNAMQATLVDNKMNVFLQTTIQSIDAQISEVRNSTALVPKQIYLEWRRDVKQSIQTVCKVISPGNISSATGNPEPIPQPNFEKEIGTLKKKHEAEKEELLKREEKHKQTISQLKGRLADKEKTLPYRDENLKSLEEEMGRFSEKSHAVFDKYSEDKSKFDESETLLAGVRLELQGQKALVAKLQTGNQDLEEKNANLVREQMQLESEITASRSQMESLSGNSSFTRNESEKKQRSTNTQSAETEVSLLKARSAELERELAMRVQLIEQLSKGPAESEYETLRSIYSQLENELIQIKQRGAAAPNSFKSESQSRLTHSEVATSEKRELQEEVEELKLDLDLKTSECDDLKKKVTSLGSELREARDLLASKLCLMGEIEERETERDVCGLSVSQSLGAEFKRSDLGVNTQQPTGPAIKRQHSDTIDVDRVRQLEKQLQQLQLQLSDAKNNIKILQNVCGEKISKNNILRENLDTSRKELETTKLELLRLSVLSKPDSRRQSAGNALKIQSNKVTSVEEKQPEPSQTAVNPIKQHKYKITNLYFDGKYTKFYSLDQAENPETLIQELAVCRPKGGMKHVVGTIKAIVPGRWYKYKDTIVGIEFLDPMGDSNGEYKYTRYFHTQHNHAVFLPINEVYVRYDNPTMPDV